MPRAIRKLGTVINATGDKSVVESPEVTSKIAWGSSGNTSDSVGSGSLGGIAVKEPDVESKPNVLLSLEYSLVWFSIGAAVVFTRNLSSDNGLLSLSRAKGAIILTVPSKMASPT